jgi:hypothetical protein
MSRETSIIYLRAGRKLRARGSVLDHGPNGMLKVKPTRDDWNAIWITADESAAGKTKPAPIERKAPTAPRKPAKPKPAPLPRWKQLVAEVRMLELCQSLNPKPCVSKEFLSALADELEAAHGLFTNVKHTHR